MKLKKLYLLLPLAIILYACPYESGVPLVTHPTEPVDTSLMGYWYGIVKDGSDFFGIEALEISKQSDSVYSIIRYGKAIKGDIILPDTAYFTGYTSTIGDQRFMNVEGSVVITTNQGKKAPVVKVEKVYYLSALDKSHDTLSVRTITEKFSPARKAFSTADLLNTEVTEQLRLHHNIYDDLYSLSYRKIPKPKSF